MASVDWSRKAQLIGSLSAKEEKRRQKAGKATKNFSSSMWPSQVSCAFFSVGVASGQSGKKDRMWIQRYGCKHCGKDS